MPCKILFIVTLFILSGAYILFANAKTAKKLVIDNDAGGDDAMAIFLALLHEEHFNGPEVVALTTVNGNAEEVKVQLNNQRILSVAKRQDVPIYRGATSALVLTPEPSAYFGIDGLGDANMTYSYLKPPESMHAVMALIELSKKHAGDLKVVTLGPLTNIALALLLDPQFLDRLDQLYVAAGAIKSAEFSYAEFNVQSDVEAYHVVAQHATSGKVTVFPFSQTMISFNITKDWRNNVLGAISSDIMSAQNLYEAVALALPEEHWYALDPAMMALVINPSLVDEMKLYKNSIILCGDDRGINTNEETENATEANVNVIYSAHKEPYMQFLIDVFSKSSSTKKVTK